jgi:3-hydroxy-9,10-secoandrosta-1,3,5(10)-triene-9,17-dione monooxygenase
MNAVAKSNREPGTRAELAARAEALGPFIAERARQADIDRRLSDEVVEAMVDAGLFHAIQPARFGGSELDYATIVDITSIIAKSCASAGWILGNFICHQYMLATWPKEAQEEIWSPSPDALVSGVVIFPCGRAVREGDGYRLKGRWPFGSGSAHTKWCVFGAMTDEGTGDGATALKMFNVPRSDYEIIETWETAGLRGTGSNDLVVDDVFVPAHRALDLEDIKGGDHPGSDVNPGAVYRVPVYAMFPYVLNGVAMGIAQGVIERYTEKTKTQAARYSGQSIADLTTIQVKVAEAAASVDAAFALSYRNCEDVMEIARAGDVPTLEQKVKYRRDGAYAVKLCTHAVDLLFGASGGGGLYDSNPISRAFRDIHAVSAHITQTWDVNAAMYGRVMLGLDPDNPTL